MTNHYGDSLNGLWCYCLVCFLLAAAMWYANRNTPKGS
jgi:hypothetical protein